MIHEALFALWNSAEDVKESTTDLLNSVGLHEFLHPGEQQLMQKIKNVGSNYREIEKFRKTVTSRHRLQYRVGPMIGKEVELGSYVKAFCNGLDEVLQSYRDKIVNIEQQVLKNSCLTLTYVFASVDQYNPLFDVLKKMIRMVQMERIHGSVLMGRLHMFTDSGVPSIVYATNKIIKCVNTIFYRQLSNWIIYGDLVDVCDEFFIGDSNCPDENFMYPEELAEDATKPEVVRTFRKKRIMRPSQVRKFYIKTELVPSVISLEAAETILFMGRIVWIVRNNVTTNNRDLKFKRDIWNGKAVEYYKKIQQLENHSFNLIKFDRTIEECRLKLTKYLWSIMVEEAKLLEHLQLIRDYHALGRGELFRQFIVAAESQLSGTSEDYAAKKLNFIFTECATKIYGERDKSYLKFELGLIKSADIENLSPNPNPWAQLEINFDIPWPLHIVFHPKIIELYNKLFCFLLRITKTQINLHKLWQNHMSSKQDIDKTVWMLRQNLMFLVNNLQYYLQVDVIEAEFSLLQKAVKCANEFEDIIRLHSKFLSNLLSKTFVMAMNVNSYHVRTHCLYQLPPLYFDVKSTQMHGIILLLLELCDDFCTSASNWETTLNEMEREKLDELKKRSDAVTDMLLRVLYTMHRNVSGSHLLQLLHRLDFNRWYSKSKLDFSLISL